MRPRVLLVLALVPLLGLACGETNTVRAQPPVVVAAADGEGRAVFGLPAVPDGPTVANEYGVPLTAAEVEHLKFIDDVVTPNVQALVARVASDPGLAGVWIDRATNTVHISFADAMQSTIDLVGTTDVGLPIVVDRVAYTYTELDAIKRAIEADMTGIRSVGIDTVRDQVVVSVTVDAVGNALVARYGTAVIVGNRGAVGTNACGTRAACAPPMKAGLDIARSDGTRCSSAFVYQAASYLGQQKGKVATTAGHCWNGSYLTWTTGAVSMTAYQNADVNGTSADVMFMDISDTVGSNDLYEAYDSSTKSGVVIDITSRVCNGNLGFVV